MCGFVATMASAQPAASRIMAFLFARDLCAVRATCKMSAEVTSSHEYADTHALVRPENLSLWRSLYPFAVGVAVGSAQLNPELKHGIDAASCLKGLQAVAFRHCRLDRSVFAHLTEAESLRMEMCQIEDPPGCFASLPHTPDSDGAPSSSGASNAAAGGSAAAGGVGAGPNSLITLRRLAIHYCREGRRHISDRVLRQFRGLTHLSISNFDLYTPTLFSNLGSLHELCIASCTLTDDRLPGLAGLRVLQIDSLARVTNDKMAHLVTHGLNTVRLVVKAVNVNGEASRDPFEALAGVPCVHLECTDADDAAGVRVHVDAADDRGSLHSHKPMLTDDMLVRLSNASSVTIRGFDWSMVTDAGIRHVRGVKSLDVDGVHGENITRLALDTFDGLLGLKLTNSCAELMSAAEAAYARGVEKLL